MPKPKNRKKRGKSGATTIQQPQPIQREGIIEQDPATPPLSSQPIETEVLKEEPSTLKFSEEILKIGHRSFTIIANRFLDELEHTAGILFAILSVAFIHWVLGMLFQTHDDSFESKALRYIVFFVEGCLFLKLLVNFVRGLSKDS